MDKVLTILILLTELLMVLQCLQIVFKKKLPFDKFLVGIILVDVVVYTLLKVEKCKKLNIQLVEALIEKIIVFSDGVIDIVYKFSDGGM